MAKNVIRSSQSMATVAPHTLAGRLDDALREQIVWNLLHGANEWDDFLEEIARSLAGSVLANRKARRTFHLRP